MYQWLFFHTFPIKCYNTIILNEKVRGGVTLYLIFFRMYLLSRMYLLVLFHGFHFFVFILLTEILYVESRMQRRLISQNSKNLRSSCHLNMNICILLFLSFLLKLLKLSLRQLMKFFNFHPCYFPYGTPYVLLYELALVF